jgi:hypothetical protein
VVGVAEQPFGMLGQALASPPRDGLAELLTVTIEISTSASTTKTSNHISENCAGRSVAGPWVSKVRNRWKSLISEIYIIQIGGYTQWALGVTPIAAFAWQDHEVNIRVFWQDSYRALFESKYSSGWTGPSKVTNSVDENSPFAAVELQNGAQHRVYVRESTSLVEKCNGKYGSYWFNGVFVVR